jgi:hypothetical protein
LFDLVWVFQLSLSFVIMDTMHPLLCVVFPRRRKRKKALSTPFFGYSKRFLSTGFYHLDKPKRLPHKQPQQPTTSDF